MCVCVNELCGKETKKESESVLTFPIESNPEEICPVCPVLVNRLLNDIKQSINIIQPNRPTKFNNIHIYKIQYHSHCRIVVGF